MSEELKLVEKAKAIAEVAHLGQFRRDGKTPYINHPADVAARLEGNPQAQVVAWLHDVLEDTDETVESLARRGIPRHLITCVIFLTTVEGEDYEKYLRIIAFNRIATQVKIQDMLSNLSDNPTKKQVKKYAKALTLLIDRSETLGTLKWN